MDRNVQLQNEDVLKSDEVKGHQITRIFMVFPALASLLLLSSCVANVHPRSDTYDEQSLIERLQDSGFRTSNTRIGIVYHERVGNRVLTMPDQRMLWLLLSNAYPSSKWTIKECWELEFRTDSRTAMLWVADDGKAALKLDETARYVFLPEKPDGFYRIGGLGEFLREVETTLLPQEN